MAPQGQKHQDKQDECIQVIQVHKNCQPFWVWYIAYYSELAVIASSEDKGSKTSN